MSRPSCNRNPSTWTYNSADQLTDWPGQHKYTYLVTGSLAEQRNSAGTEVEKGYSYTYRNLLSTVTHYDEANDPVSSMGWDAEDNRVSFTSSTGGTTYFVYDPTAGIPAVIEEVTPGGSVFYVREPNGNLIARVTGATAANIRYYHFDALGSTRVLTDGNGAKTDEYTYDAWGNLANHSGGTQQPYQYVGQLGYYSHYQDVHLPMLQLGVRFYDPRIGRFTQMDPIHTPAEPSTYAYALDNPLFYTDASGLKATDPSMDWIKKSWNCTKKAADSCRGKMTGGKMGKDYEKCFWKEYGLCMGKAWSKASCQDYYCVLFPRSPECSGGINPCNREDPDPCHRQDCCDIKYNCCLVVELTPVIGSGQFAPAKCYFDSLACPLKSVQ